MALLGRILIVDDEPKIRSFIGRALSAAGYAPAFAATGAEAVRSCAAGRYDLVILDLVIGDMDGREVLSALLAGRPEQAVIVLSCVSDVAAKVDLLERGAQDYLTKPFSLAELLARVRVRLRAEPQADAATTAGAVDAVPAGGPGRPQPLMPPLTAPRAALGPGVSGHSVSGHSVSGHSVSGHSASGRSAGGYVPGELVQAGRLTLDVGKLAADIGEGPVPLTRLEFMLLRELAERTGHSVSKGSLLASVWGYDFDPGSNVVDVCVRRIRSKLGFDLIKTVRGEGYQLVAR
jgi:DNA-binding response OmpR family regulator